MFKTYKCRLLITVFLLLCTPSLSAFPSKDEMTSTLKGFAIPVIGMFAGMILDKKVFYLSTPFCLVAGGALGSSIDNYLWAKDDKHPRARTTGYILAHYGFLLYCGYRKYQAK